MIEDSLYKQYITEMTDRTVLETEDYFIDYDIVPGFLRVKHVYIVPEKRATGLFQELQKVINDIAKENGCVEMLMSIDATYKGFERLISHYENNGCVIHATDDNICKLYKKVE